MSLYHRHLQTLVQRYNEACEQFHLDSIILHSGSTRNYPGDDYPPPFKPNPYAQQWLPYSVAPETYVVFSKQQGLILYWPASQDFWHVMPTEPAGAWTKDWRIEANTHQEWMSGLSGNTAFISHYADMLDLPETFLVNPNDLLSWLQFDRAYKTEWEIENLRSANQSALKGHKAAVKAFEDGLSEYDIHRAYLQATQQQQIEEPYGSIIALNEAAAVLHYEQKKILAPAHSKTLLIDAGTQVNGYASDITRTTTRSTGIFAQLIDEVDSFQQRLVELCTVGHPYLEVHNAALHETAQLLHKTGLCSLTVEAQMAKKIPQTFFPHGIGHLLGLQVHDAGGYQVDRSGQEYSRLEHAPYLRLMRPLEEGMVLTIEPGFYFIPMLIDKMIQQTPDHGCDLALIDELKPFGGIRIEDNVVVRAQGPENLTRLAEK